MVMLTDDPKLFEQLITPAIDSAIDSIYDYLQSPDQTEIAALQAELAPIAAALPAMIETQIAQKATIVTGDAAKLGASIASKIGNASKDYATIRMRDAFTKASGEQSFETFIDSNIQRLEHAASTGTFTDLNTLNQANTQRSAQKMAVGIVQLGASDKLVPLMKELAQNLDKADFSKAVHYLVNKGLQIKTRAEEIMENMENDPSALSALEEMFEDETMAGQLKATQKMQEMLQKEIIDGVSTHFNITSEGTNTFGRIVTAIENSLISSGAITEAEYENYLVENYTNSMRAANGYDAMHGFSPKI